MATVAHAAGETLVIEGIPVERCKAHGAWFDRQELERVLSPDVTPESFGADYELRQGLADTFEFGAGIGRVIVVAIYRRIRRRKDTTRGE
jgi:hypothetical protein